MFKIGFENQNWGKYGIEFLSVFIAVISAFALNNWNDNRKNHITEEKILWEILQGLEKDIDDLFINQSGHKAGIEATVFFKDILANKVVSQDSILYYYHNLTRDFISIQNTSGYEVLKSKGLEIIENDVLRSGIISLYEYEYEILRKLEEQYYETQFQENYFKEINLMISKSFELNDNKEIVGIKIPLDISPTEEKELMTYLWKIEQNRRFILNYYPIVIEKIEMLRNEILENE